MSTLVKNTHLLLLKKASNRSPAQPSSQSLSSSSRSFRSSGLIMAGRGARSPGRRIGRAVGRGGIRGKRFSLLISPLRKQKQQFIEEDRELSSTVHDYWLAQRLLDRLWRRERWSEDQPGIKAHRGNHSGWAMIRGARGITSLFRAHLTNKKPPTILQRNQIRKLFVLSSINYMLAKHITFQCVLNQTETYCILEQGICSF